MILEEKHFLLIMSRSFWQVKHFFFVRLVSIPELMHWKTDIKNTQPDTGNFTDPLSVKVSIRFIVQCPVTFWNFWKLIGIEVDYTLAKAERYLYKKRILETIENYFWTKEIKRWVLLGKSNNTVAGCYSIHSLSKAGR